ncbi:hypothetical protein AAFC00_001522 [Neodothiora populina]|uniref:Uncharacterized protein n=1 Tax=Neodothiora populina TaxID=2781224 RepID=A0ABR3PPG3_9PEZI
MLRRSTRQSLQGTRKRSASPSANDKKNKNPRASVSTYERTNLKTQRAPSDKSNLDQGEAATGTEMASGDESESINDNISEFSAAPSGDSAEESPSDLSDGDDYDSQQTKRGRKSFPKGVARNQIVEARGSRELWREGVRTGAPPGTQVIIKKPKARPAGKTPYSECTIHPNTMLFLSDLKDNNQREWLKMHDPDYRASLSDWNTFIEVVTQKLCEIDDTIPELPVKDITYRIHRDIRFSPDKTPYKTYFSAAWYACNDHA